MSRKKTKPPAKSGKDESPIRSSPATRALRFLLGKQPEQDPKQAAHAQPSTEQSLAEQSSTPQPSTPQPSTLPAADQAPISNEIEIGPTAGSQRAGSKEAGSGSQLPAPQTEASEPPESQLGKSRLPSSQLSESRHGSGGPRDRFEPAPLALNWRAVEHSRIPQVVFDEILPQLPPMAQVPYLQLLRLTLGFQRANCHISLESWAARCNQSLASIKRQAAVLQQRGLLRKESVVYGGVARGSYYRPIIPGILNDERGSQLPSSRLSESQLGERRLTEGHMKRDHEDHGKKTDHHQSRVMTIYEELTGNRATGADLAAYRKIAHLNIETVEAHMRQIYERSLEPIGSFAYFAKAVLKATEESQRTRAAQKRNLERIIARIRQNRTGARATLADLIEDIKRACARDNVAYNNDLVNEILGL